MNKIYYYLAGFLVLSGGLGAMVKSDDPAKKPTFVAVLKRMKNKEKYFSVVKQVPQEPLWHDGIKDVRRFVLKKRHYLYPEGE